MTGGPILKYMPEDFAVREVLQLILSNPDGARYRYLVLKKCGFTTREAIPLVAELFGVPPVAVTYAGLKDEDAITEQYLAIACAEGRPDPALPWSFNDGNVARWFTLSLHGHGAMPLQIGALDGNIFLITVRNIEAGLAERLQLTWGAGSTASFPILNYYDVQRFGVPHGPKRSHYVGEHILAGRWPDAIRELAALNAAESRAALEWEGDPAAFFREMDPRAVVFYLSAFASAQWNRALSATIAAALADGYRDMRVDGLDFRLVCDPARLHELSACAPWLPYKRYGWDQGRITEGASNRATVVQTSITTGPFEPDRFHPGRLAWQLQFFLPSGCYATAVVRQLLTLSELTDMHIALQNRNLRPVAAREH
jgi:tRNA pseudouridine13 synthase